LVKHGSNKTVGSGMRRFYFEKALSEAGLAVARQAVREAGARSGGGRGSGRDTPCGARGAGSFPGAAPTSETISPLSRGVSSEKPGAF